MKLKITLFTFFVFLHLMVIGQKQSVRIGPPCPKQQYEPLFVIDGIRIPPSVGSKFMDEKKEIIDSLSLQPDSIFDCNGKVTNFGIVRIFTKDSINTGAKKIQFLTDYYLNKKLVSKLIVNNNVVDWDEKTYHKLISLKPCDILSAKILNEKGNFCDRLLEIKIKE